MVSTYLLKRRRVVNAVDGINILTIIVYVGSVARLRVFMK